MANCNEERTLFVYGSLLDPVRRQQVIGRQVDTLTATIHGYQVGCARYFFIRPQPGVSTRGVLLLQLTLEEFRLLDLYEEIPRLYTREKVEVIDDGGRKLRCWVYLPTTATLSGQS